MGVRAMQKARKGEKWLVHRVSTSNATSLFHGGPVSQEETPLERIADTKINKPKSPKRGKQHCPDFSPVRFVL